MIAGELRPPRPSSAGPRRIPGAAPRAFRGDPLSSSTLESMPDPIQLLTNGVLVALLVGCAAPTAPTVSEQATPAGDYSRPRSGRFTFTFGERRLDGALAPTDEPRSFGLEFSRLPVGGGPLGFELGFQFADDQARGVPLPGGGSGTVDRFQSEFYAGLRAEGGEGSVHPYLGLGAAWLHDDNRVRSGGLETRDSDGSLGAYGHLGLLLDLSPSVHVTVDGRMTFLGDSSIDGADGDYAQVSIGLGASF